MSNRRKARQPRPPRRAAPAASAATGTAARLAHAARYSVALAAWKAFSAAARDANTHIAAGRAADAETIMTAAWNQLVQAINAADTLGRHREG